MSSMIPTTRTPEAKEWRILSQIRRCQTQQARLEAEIERHKAEIDASYAGQREALRVEMNDLVRNGLGLPQNAVLVNIDEDKGEITYQQPSGAKANGRAKDEAAKAPAGNGG